MSIFISKDAQRTFVQTVSKTLSANNTTAAVPIFRIIGAVDVVALWGVVTTALGSNNTAAYWRLNDQTAQVNITVSTGTTLSSAPAGSIIVKKDLAANALVLKSSAAGAISEPTTLETSFFSPFVLVKKSSANTDIEFVYTTNQTPTSGVIQFFVEWRPLSEGASINAV
jgi:hypothetical protein